MRYTNWLLIAISVAVHLAVIGSLQLNVASSAPGQSIILLQLRRMVDPPAETKPEPVQTIEPEVIARVAKKPVLAKAAPHNVQQLQPRPFPAKVANVPEQIAIPTTQIQTVALGGLESVSSSAGFTSKPALSPQLSPETEQHPQSLPEPTPLPIPDPTPAPSIDIAELLRNYAGGVKRGILAAQSYPATAERLGHEGTVQVGFSIAMDGSLSSVQVKSSSGFDTIDSAAIAAVQAAAPFTAIPMETNRDSLSMSISLKYYLE